MGWFPLTYKQILLITRKGASDPDGPYVNDRSHTRTTTRTHFRNGLQIGTWHGRGMSEESKERELLQIVVDTRLGIQYCTDVCIC